MQMPSAQAAKTQSRGLHSAAAPHCALFLKQNDAHHPQWQPLESIPPATSAIRAPKRINFFGFMLRVTWRS